MKCREMSLKFQVLSLALLALSWLVDSEIVLLKETQRESNYWLRIRTCYWCARECPRECHLCPVTVSYSSKSPSLPNKDHLLLVRVLLFCMDQQAKNESKNLGTA